MNHGRRPHGHTSVAALKQFSQPNCSVCRCLNLWDQISKGLRARITPPMQSPLPSLAEPAQPCDQNHSCQVQGRAAKVCALPAVHHAPCPHSKVIPISLTPLSHPDSNVATQLLLQQARAAAAAAARRASDRPAAPTQYWWYSQATTAPFGAQQLTAGGCCCRRLLLHARCNGSEAAAHAQAPPQLPAPSPYPRH